MSQNTENENWKEIKGYEGLYAVSDRGRVKSLSSGKVLKPGVDSHGYAFVGIHKNGKSKQCRIHRLVADAFIPNPENLPYINHISEDKRDNNVSNLEWVTASQNIRHSIHQQSCKINQLTFDGQFVKQWNSSHEVERELKFPNTYIIQCCKGRRKMAYNYRWEYADPSQQKKYNRRVAALTKDGEYVAEYKSASEAARCLKISTTQIYLCLNGTYKSTHGLKFKYLDSFKIINN